jgi:hypothetical protein
MNDCRRRSGNFATGKGDSSGITQEYEIAHRY